MQFNSRVGALHQSPTLMMIIAFVSHNSSLGHLIEILCGSNPWEFEFLGFRWNRTYDLGINSPLL